MNILLLRPEDFITADTAKISGRRLTQLREVIRANAGKICKAGLLGGSVGTAEILEITSEHAVVTVALNSAPPLPSSVNLIVALPRPKTFTKILHAATELGVKEIWFINSFKVEKAYWQSPRLEAEALNSELILALEQARDTVLPKIVFRKLFKPFVEDELPTLCRGAKCFLGDPTANSPLPTVPSESKIWLALGPEGGFTDYENNKFVDCGFIPTQLGERVLRSEVAVSALLGYFSFRAGKEK